MMTTLPATMAAIDPEGPGGPEVLTLVERPVPKPGRGEVLVKVAAAGVNRPDVAQRMGVYPPPTGAPTIPGLEIAGEVVAVGDDVDSAMAGQKVCALVGGGGYAEYCAAPIGQCLPVPAPLTMLEAAALPGFPIDLQRLQLIVEIEADAFAQFLEVDAASRHDLGGVGVLDKGEQKMLQGRIFVPAAARFGERRVERLFQFAGE